MYLILAAVWASFLYPFCLILVGARGKVFCVDLQDKMIKGLLSRAIKADYQTELTHEYVVRTPLGWATLPGKSISR